MATLDHVCRQCGHGWLSNTDDEHCELCGSDDINDCWDDEDEDWGWPDLDAGEDEYDYGDAA
jgi:hypothetical protein